MRTNEVVTLLPEMVVFAEVVSQGSFTEAARRLGLTPSATSRSVSRLEKALGVQLLYRTTRHLRLSASGEEFILHCQEMLRAANSAIQSTNNQNLQPQGTLHVSAPKAVARRLVHPYIEDFLASYPALNIHLLYEDRSLDLINEELDLTLRITDKPSPGLMGRVLMRIHHVICAAPKYFKNSEFPRHPKDLERHNCICLGETLRDSCWRFTQNRRRVNVQVRGRYSANHSGARLDSALSGFGIASLPYFVAQKYLQQGSIIQVLPDWEFSTDYCGDLWALHTPTRHTPLKISVFTNFLSKKIAQTFSDI